MGVLERGAEEERFRPCRLLCAHVEAGRLGRKSGHGFYRYDAQGRRSDGPGG